MTGDEPKRWGSYYVVKVMERLAGELGPAAERMEVVGSMRRGRDEVHDGEFLVIPKTTSDLLGDVLESLFDVALQGLVDSGYLLRGDRCGPRLKTFKVPSLWGLPIEFYITTPEKWGVLAAIRTGPAGLSKRMVTQRSMHGLLRNDLRVSEGRVWGQPNSALETPEEVDFFRLLSCGWVDPGGRDVLWQEWPMT